MLRESSKLEGDKVDLKIITSGLDVDGGVPEEKALVDFAEAALGQDTQAISTARSNLEQKIGTDGMIDAAAVIANFQRMVRIADGAGIPLDAPVAMVTAGMRDDLGINEFSSASYTPAVGFFKRALGSVLGLFLPIMLRRMSKSAD
ncbi:MAG TPA: hypothetical protein EYQ14_08810 [Gammaproteobacteria bacterium]|nr:hypothetical protein [Gammaproteobacteria bacterium]